MDKIQWKKSRFWEDNKGGSSNRLSQGKIRADEVQNIQGKDQKRET